MEHRTAGCKEVHSRRVAQNTVVLFVRMLLILIINLYAVRVVLQALGEVDYGIFNSIAGFVLMGSSISITLSLAVQRFYSYTLGSGDTAKLSEIFSASLNIVLAVSLCLILILETFGLWFVSHHLMEPLGHIPLLRKDATLWLFQAATVSFLFSFLQLPYLSSVIAHEDMKCFAYVSLLECVGRLVVALLIPHASMDALVFYGLGLMVVSAFVCVIYMLFCKWRYLAIHYVRVVHRDLYRDLLSFAGWTMYGTVSNVAMIQGNTILLMRFFGPLSNAAYGVANQVYNAANALCNSVVVAIRPAMVKLYAEADYSNLDRMFQMSNKCLAYLLLCVVFPAVFEMRTVLGWWLGDSMSEETVLFARLFIIYWACMSLHHPLTIIVQSTGRVKDYFLWVESITLLSFPLTYVLFRLGWPSYGTFLSMIILCMSAHLVRLICLKRVYTRFHIRAYVLSLLLPVVCILCVNGAFTAFLHAHIHSPLLRFLSVGFLSPMMVLLLAYLAGTTRDEKALLHSLVSKRFNRRL